MSDRMPAARRVEGRVGRCLNRPAPLLLAVCGAVCIGAAAEPNEAALFRALGDEMKRSMMLRLEELGAPYFIQFSVDEQVTWRIAAGYGGLVSSERSESRVLHSQLRVGAYELDNSNFSGRGGGARGLVGSAALPLEDDYMAIRHAVWRVTDSQYRAAVEVFTQKQAYMRDRNIQDRPRDFAAAEPLAAVRERAELSMDSARWEDYARQISARFARHPQIQNADVSFVAGTENRYLLNSEGSRVRVGDTGALLRLSAEAQAADGERLADQVNYYAGIPEELPPLEKVLEEADRLAQRLAGAIAAPVLDNYSGPVLFDAPAAAQVFRQLLSRGIAGAIDPVGAPRRSGTGGDDLENRIGRRILPQSFRVYDDPRENRFEGEYLAGHYEIDDEGVAAARVEVVAEGKLLAMVMSRAPTRQFASSTGHGRRVGGEAPRAAIGCLFIESTQGQSPEDLKKELIDAADSEGLEFGVRVASVQSRGGGGGRFRGGGGARAVGDPIEIYKVHVKDGREERVRGCEFTTLDVRSLRRIIAVGSERAVLNTPAGGSPASSVIAPGVLFEEVDLIAIRQEPEKKPILDAPIARR